MLRVSKVKKPVSVLATSMSMSGARDETLEYVPYIYYPVQFKKNINKSHVQALINSESEVNVIYLSFAKQLSLSIRLIDVGAQKIEDIILDTHEMVVVTFLVVDNVNRVWFLEKTFLMANISLKVVLAMLFFTLSGADIHFLGQELW